MIKIKLRILGIFILIDNNPSAMEVMAKRFANVKNIASAITPVPGGVGPMTIAMLLKNTLKAHRLQLKNNISG